MLNTNLKNNPSGQDEADMIKERKAAAYYGRWKQKITYLRKGDTVYLYSNGKGIIAYGIVEGELQKKAYEENENEEYYRILKDFKEIDPPIPASKFKEITNSNFSFMQTMIDIGEVRGKILTKYLKSI